MLTPGVMKVAWNTMTAALVYATSVLFQNVKSLLDYVLEGVEDLILNSIAIVMTIVSFMMTAALMSALNVL